MAEHDLAGRSWLMSFIIIAGPIDEADIFLEFGEEEGQRWTEPLAQSWTLKASPETHDSADTS